MTTKRVPTKRFESGWGRTEAVGAGTLSLDGRACHHPALATNTIACISLSSALLFVCLLTAIPVPRKNNPTRVAIWPSDKLGGCSFVVLGAALSGWYRAVHGDHHIKPDAAGTPGMACVLTPVPLTRFASMSDVFEMQWHQQYTAAYPVHPRSDARGMVCSTTIPIQRRQHRRMRLGSEL